MGVSHFLEHMAFKGSGELTGEAIDKAFDDLGLDHNAWTSAEATAFGFTHVQIGCWRSFPSLPHFFDLNCVVKTSRTNGR